MTTSLDDAQRSFLIKLATDEGSVQEVAKKAGVDRQTLRTWLESPAFRAALRKLCEQTLTLGSVDAADRLASAVLGEELSTTQHRACVDVIKLARSRPTKKASKATAAAEVAAHPSVDADEAARLRDVLDG